MATLLDNIWDAHVISDLDDGYQLLHIDRHFLHDLSGPGSLRAIQKRGLTVRNPDLTFATADHCVATSKNRDEMTTEFGSRLIPVLRSRCKEEDIRYFGLDSVNQGIVHVIGPELGLTLPGLTVVCGGSHTCTHGALGALGWGIGSSELNHVLTTQCLIEQKPGKLRINFNGQLQKSVTAKDMILYLIARHGADLGVGSAVEFAGDTTRHLPIEARMTLCNLSIEMGSKIGVIAPDDTTYQYISQRPFAPSEDGWDTAMQYWQTLPSSHDAVFDREVNVNANDIEPQISWGISPEHTIGVSDVIPDPNDAPDTATQYAWRQALDYMGLTPGKPIAGLPIQRVFIGSCANSRLSDLKAAADVARSGHVKAGVTAWVVPGSQQVKQEAESLGLDSVFLEAGFEWREPGCSQCVATNGEYIDAGDSCVSTSNRNFMGRQGPGARTHLSSPVMATAAALKGAIVDARDIQAAI